MATPIFPAFTLSAKWRARDRSEEHTSELQSPCISYAAFCLKKHTGSGRPACRRGGGPVDLAHRAGGLRPRPPAGTRVLGGPILMSHLPADLAVYAARTCRHLL